MKTFMVAASLASAVMFLLGVVSGFYRAERIWSDQARIDDEFLRRADFLLYNAGGGPTPAWSAAREQWREMVYKR